MCWCDGVCADCGHSMRQHETNAMVGACAVCSCGGWHAGPCYPTGCPVLTTEQAIEKAKGGS